MVIMQRVVFLLCVGLAIVGVTYVLGVVRSSPPVSDVTSAVPAVLVDPDEVSSTTPRFDSDIARAAYLDGIFDHESRDEAWASATELTIGRSVGGLAPDLAPETFVVRCASTMCRIELTFTSSQVRNQVMRQMVHMEPFFSQPGGSVAFVEDDPAHPRAVMHAIREGHAMPF